MNTDFASQITAYQKAHQRGSYRARWDAYGLATMHLQSGRTATYAEINPLINGGRCTPSAVRAGIRDAIRDAR